MVVCLDCCFLASLVAGVGCKFIGAKGHFGMAFVGASISDHLFVFALVFDTSRPKSVANRPALWCLGTVFVLSIFIHM